MLLLQFEAGLVSMITWKRYWE